MVVRGASPEGFGEWLIVHGFDVSSAERLMVNLEWQLLRMMDSEEVKGG